MRKLRLKQASAGASKPTDPPEAANPTPARHQVVEPEPSPSDPPKPLYWRLLRLRWVRPGGWVRVLLIEGLILVAVVLCLAGAAPIWSVLVLPAVGAVIVKGHDVLAGAIRHTRTE